MPATLRAHSKKKNRAYRRTLGGRERERRMTEASLCKFDALFVLSSFSSHFLISTLLCSLVLFFLFSSFLFQLLVFFPIAFSVILPLFVGFGKLGNFLSMADISFPPMEQLQDLEYCIDSNPSWGMLSFPPF